MASSQQTANLLLLSCKQVLLIRGLKRKSPKRLLASTWTTEKHYTHGITVGSGRQTSVMEWYKEIYTYLIDFKRKTGFLYYLVFFIPDSKNNAIRSEYIIVVQTNM